MSVDIKHDDYEDKYDNWEKCRDFIEGSGAVKAKGDEYLPKLDKQDDKEFENYVDRALFYGASGRTHLALLGSIFRKDPMLEGLESVDERDISMKGLSLTDFARKVTDEVLAVGRYGVLVEYSEEEGKPFLVGYTAENIRNWRIERINGKMVVTLVVLEEQEEEEGDSEFSTDKVTVYRALRLINGIYTVEEYRASTGDDATGAPTLRSSTVPVRNGAALNEIPFVFFGPENLQPQISKPPLMDLIEVNNSHYMSSADLENGRHLVGLPTPVFLGMGIEDEVVLGSQNAIKSDTPGGSAFFLEFTGSGLTTLENALREKEHLMSVMGAKLIEPPRAGVEAAETARIRQAGDASLLAMIGKVVSEGMSEVMRTFVWWSGLEPADTLRVELNNDFIDFRMEPNELTAFMSAYLSGGISYETLFYNLKKGEIIKKDRSMEEEQDDIDTGDLPGAETRNTDGNTG